MVTQLQDVPIPEELNPLKLALDAARTAVEKASKDREELEEKVRPATARSAVSTCSKLGSAVKACIPQHADAEVTPSSSQACSQDALPLWLSTRQPCMPDRAGLAEQPVGCRRSS